MGLEEVLTYLARFGNPRIGIYTGPGWHCHVEMFVTGQGISFEIKSGFQHKTPLEAALECKKRLEEALISISKNVPTIGG